MPSKTLLMQTSDPFNYYDMLQATSRTVKAYCFRWRFDYEQYIGVKRGSWPWQATFNRLYMFKELEARGFNGWCLYLDADAYVADINFDLRQYLEERRDFALVCTPSGSSDLPYDVNIGVLGVNFGHASTAEILQRWRSHFDDVTDAELLAGKADWAREVPDDQVMLQWTLRDFPHLAAQVHHSSHTDINSPHARFIRQYLRAFDYDLTSRTERIRQITDEVLAGFAVGKEENARPTICEGLPLQVYDNIVEGLYREILGRSSDPQGLQGCRGLLIDEGLGVGLPRLVGLFLQGDEYRTRLAAAEVEGGPAT